MALVDFSFYSESLMRKVSAKAIIPIDNMLDSKPPYKTLYLLHGLTGDSNDWMLYTDIYDIAMNNGIAVIMPNGENMFYTNNLSTGYPFGKYIGEDLISATRKLFPLSDKREDTFIAGLSMGGYGAIRNGLEYYKVFGGFAGFSPALITGWAKEPWFWEKRAPFHEWDVFGDPEAIAGSNHDPYYLIDKMASEDPEEMPRIYLSCGTEDDLIAPTRDLRDYLKSKDFDFTYYEGPGQHDWEFWRADIRRMLKAFDLMM